MLDLQPIKDRLAAASPWPWHWSRAKPWAYVARLHDIYIFGDLAAPSSTQQDEADADLIANAPSDLTALVAEVERLENEAAVMQQVTLAGLAAEVERLRGAIEDHRYDSALRSVWAHDHRLWAVLDA